MSQLNEAGDWSAAAGMQSRSGVILRDFSPEEPALSEVEGIWRAPAQLPAFFPMRSPPDASPTQRHAVAEKGYKFSHTTRRRERVFRNLGWWSRNQLDSG
jgi:hypothetical protein